MQTGEAGILNRPLKKGLGGVKSGKTGMSTQMCKFMSKNLKFAPEICQDGEGKRTR